MTFSISRNVRPLAAIVEGLPRTGIVAEEDGAQQPCANCGGEHDIWVVLDDPIEPVAECLSCFMFDETVAHVTLGALRTESRPSTSDETEEILRQQAAHRERRVQEAPEWTI